ncbi:hypothetical protein ACDH70_19505 [Xanthomonas axonopodis pv. poinsettiicola]|uniref:hypothetical protein n=1 Tax=Xanthomonas TaxID=338 RepID=UPI001E5DFE3B|nr:hypothetical protein [Xanthomonas codiaei]MCC8538469.1 hypothetical protein [Xanthomonas codiaei]
MIGWTASIDCRDVHRDARARLACGARHLQGMDAIGRWLSHERYAASTPQPEAHAGNGLDTETELVTDGADARCATTSRLPDAGFYGDRHRDDDPMRRRDVQSAEDAASYRGKAAPRAALPSSA